MVNREKKRRERVKKGIKIEEEHFKEVLGGLDWRIRRERGGEGRNN